MIEKIVERDILAQQIRMFKKKGDRIVFTNGCFDLLHVGHVRYLAAARAQGDILVVGLNTDRSVRAIKGDKRPIVPERERAEVLAALSIVDFVTLFDEADPLTTIQALLPDVLVKGADWAKEAIVGADAVESAGGLVVRVPLTQGASTTGIIERIISTFCNERQ
jgi:D-beta-D-heptose 7-phosphate kinase/D-beta-D-heptose 1-phosphate adenosyltransferase